LNLEEDNVGVVLGPSTGIKEGSIAKEHNVSLLKVGEQMVGRSNTLGFQLMENWWRLIRNAFGKKSS
jgi:F0F1-type ATP synthase alpha subunit